MDAVKTIFQNIKAATQQDLNEPTVIAKALGKIEAYAEVGVELIEQDSENQFKAHKNQTKISRDKIKIVVYLVSNGAKECELLDGDKLPLENATLENLRESKKLLQKRLKAKKQ